MRISKDLPFLSLVPMIAILTFKLSSRIRATDTNREERHGGPAMWVLTDQKRFITLPFPIHDGNKSMFHKKYVIMNNFSLSKEKASGLRNLFIHGVDKYYRMAGGMSSELISLHEGVLNLEVEVFKPSKKSVGEIAAQFFLSYQNFDDLLAKASRYRIKIHISGQDQDLIQDQRVLPDQEIEAEGYNYWVVRG
jgi:hypothetical protein